MRSRLLAFSFSMAFALLVDPVTVQAQQCHYHQCNKAVRQQCTSPMGHQLEIDRSSRKNSLSGLVKIYNPRLSETDVLSWMKYIWTHHANESYKKARREIDCACPGDIVCFPDKRAPERPHPISTPVSPRHPAGNMKCPYTDPIYSAPIDANPGDKVTFRGQIHICNGDTGRFLPEKKCPYKSRSGAPKKANHGDKVTFGVQILICNGVTGRFER
jgi:hypothetical protein